MQSIKLFFKGWKQGMHEFGQALASIINFILLTIVFIFGIGLVSMVSKLKGKKFLKEIENEDSFWVKTSIGKDKAKEDYSKPF